MWKRRQSGSTPSQMLGEVNCVRVEVKVEHVLWLGDYSVGGCRDRKNTKRMILNKVRRH